jgi:N6-adenosine-specific RNA methylase IME4
MAYVQKVKVKGKTYYRLVEKYRDEAGKWKVRFLKYLGTDPQPYLDSVNKGQEIIQAQLKYPDLAVKGGQAALAEYKRRQIPKIKLPVKTYRTIVVDPPWSMDKIIRKVVPVTQQYDFDYATMTLDEIRQLPVSQVANKDGCHLYLWTTQKFLPEAFSILKEWGFDYIFTMVWHKNGGFQPFDLPQYNCEFVLFGRIGSLKFLTTKQFFTCFNGLRREHSRKPPEFDDIVRRVSPEPRLEWFARETKEGFDTFGVETDKFKS